LISICIGSYGDKHWRKLAESRALPSAEIQHTEVLIGHEPDGTIASCRNNLAARASGDWLLFLDADDELAPRYVEAMRRAVERRRTLPPPLLTPAVSYVVNGRPRGVMFHREVTLMQANWLVIGTLIHRDVFNAVGGFQNWPHGLEDWALWSSAFKYGCKVYKVRDAVYRAHKNTQSSHNMLMRTHQHVYWHQKVGHSIWPDYFDAPTPEEDERCLLVGNRMRYR
jgi:glycosyltransferase involved in cell wall biosynthesis